MTGFLGTTLSVVLVFGLAGCSCSGEVRAGTAGAAGGFAGVTGGGSANGGSSGGGAAGAGGNGCPSASASAARVKPTVMLVVDGSRSMEMNYGNNSRWNALRTALIDPQTGIVPRLEGGVEFGLAVFSTDPMCPFPLPRIAPMLNNATAIANTLSSNTPPGTYTPTGPALDMVFAGMPDQQAVLDGELGPQIVVLATDGEPNNCVDTTRDFNGAIAAAEAGRAKGIRMYVISLADTTGEFAAHLQEMANIGAGNDRAATPAAQLYIPTNASDLSAALETIIGGAVGCDVVLNGSVAAGFECSGSATFNQTTPLTCDDPNGWTLVDPRHVRLLGTACERFKADTSIQFHIQFPCDGFVPD